MSTKNIVFIAIAAVLLMALMAGCTSSSRTVKAGDNITIDYILNSTDGKVLQTSYAQTARDLGVYDATWDYQPYTFIVGSNQTIKGVSEAVVGMNVNETKNVVIPPEKAYGAYNPSLILPVNLSELTAANITPYVNQSIISSSYGRVRVDSIDVNNSTVYVDFNRQLAGQSLLFQITVRKIE